MIHSSPTLTPILLPHSKCALIFGDRQTSYAELLRGALQWARHMPGGGARVAVFGENSPAWVQSAYAIWAAGDVLVPVDHMSTAEELAYILSDCEPALVLSSRKLFAVVERSLTKLRSLQKGPPRVMVLEDLEHPGPNDGTEAAPMPLAVDESALAAIVYTSGTTGDPKGVMLSFGNLLANVRAVAKEGYFTAHTRLLLLLPLHHVLPLAGSMVAPLFGGGTVVLATTLAGEELLSLLRRHAITTIVGVPRFYDLLHRALRDRIRASAAARSLFALARAVRSRAFSRLVFGSVHRKFGGALEHLISGGAALSRETAETFDTLGFCVCEGYGMTECSPMITFPRLGRIKIGSCGQVLDGCEARVTDVGEIVARGPNVMLGYYGRPADTAAILEDGWLHTGDLGHFDDDGYLHVTGRLKEILVLGSGKKVNPAAIEAALEATSPAVREAGVFLDGDALHALVLPNWEHLPVVDREAAEAWIRREVLAPYNATSSPYRHVVRLTLVHEELPRTRLGKLRRHHLSAIAGRMASAQTQSLAAEVTQGTARRLVAFFERQSGRPAPPTSRLVADLALDSLGRVELSVFIEREFGVVIPEARLAEIETLGDLARIVDQRRHARHDPEPQSKDAHAEESWDAEDGRVGVSWHDILHPKVPPPLPRSSAYHRALVHLSRIAVRVIFRVVARGFERLPSGPFILVSNHQSYLDGLFLSAYMRSSTVLRSLFYAKEKHVRRRWLRFLAERCNTVLMDPSQGFRRSLQQLSAALQRGDNLIIFPEGTRSADGTLGPFKDSYAILASELRVPIVPVAIAGAHAVLPTGRQLPNIFRPIQITCLGAVHPDAGEEPAALNARVRSQIADALKDLMHLANTVEGPAGRGA